MKKSQPQSIQFERVSNHTKFIFFTVAAVTSATVTGIVKGDVLYDTTSMIDKGTWDTGAQTFIGNSAFSGHLNDVQATDDFELDSSYEIENVTGDFGTIFGTPPAHGVLVELFEDSNGTPNESPAIAILSSDITVIPLDDVVGFPSFRLIVNLPKGAVSLDAGTWWISITPVDETENGDFFGQFGSTSGDFGNNTYSRNGGEDHGNGYPGPYSVNDWTLPPGVPHDPMDLAMKIEGTLVGEACPADLDGDGFVGTSDLLELFAAWGPNPESPADLDGDGSVSTSDLLELFANWGACPG
ncbi:MAG: hypothetical protein IH984_14935 [Planctomycetes bacterium]|nr:hypothetical protein [Planctomycetota bacterium]